MGVKSSGAIGGAPGSWISGLCHRQTLHLLKEELGDLFRSSIWFALWSPRTDRIRNTAHVDEVEG